MFEKLTQAVIITFLLQLIATLSSNSVNPTKTPESFVQRSEPIAQTSLYVQD